MSAQTAMGRWMLHQGHTREQVTVYEAYLDASKRGRDYVCLLRPARRLVPKKKDLIAKSPSVVVSQVEVSSDVNS